MLWAELPGTSEPTQALSVGGYGCTHTHTHPPGMGQAWVFLPNALKYPLLQRGVMHRRPLGDTLPLAAPSLHSRGWGAREEAAAGSHEGSAVYYIIIIIILLIMCCIYYKPAGLLLIGSSRQGAEAPRLRGLHHRVVLLVPSAGCRARGGGG